MNNDPSIIDRAFHRVRLISPFDLDSLGVLSTIPAVGHPLTGEGEIEPPTPATTAEVLP